jgi:hypothetical protein
LADEFVLVRLTSMRGVNLDLFDFDFDLTWAAFFLSPDEKVYGRYGGRDATAPDSRLSLQGLHYTMSKALAALRSKIEGRGLKIEDRRLDRDQNDLRSSILDPPSSNGRRSVEQFPAIQRRESNSCIHCHQVYDARREWLQTEGRWRLDEVWVYPLPENIGLTLDVDQGNLVRLVIKDSPVARAGLQTGDRLRSLNGVSVASIADVQYGLHRAPGEGEITIAWLRQAKPMSGRIKLTQGWRKTDISWRWSLRGLEPTPWVQGEDLSAEEKSKLGLNAKRLAFYQSAFVSDVARQAGIRANDIILGVDNKPLEMTARQLQAYMRLNYKIGDRVVYNIVREGHRVNLPLTLVRRPPS